MKATQSFAQDRGTGTTPAAGAKARAIQGTFTTVNVSAAVQLARICEFIFAPIIQLLAVIFLIE